MAAFIFKTEPSEYGLDDLRNEGVTLWDGIRNYGARNRLQTAELDDIVLIYHSGRNPAVVGRARVVSKPVPDPSQYDSQSPYFDRKASPAEPRWWAVEIQFVEAFSASVPLSLLKSTPALGDLELLRQQRLSVSRVGDDELAHILLLASETVDH